MTNSESLNDCDECLVDHVLLYYSENACCNSTTMIPINWYDMSIFDCNWLMMWLIIRWTGMSVCETECNGCIYLNLKWTVCVIQCNVVHFTANKPAIECTLYMAFVVLSGLAPFWFLATRSSWLLLITFIIWHSSPLSSHVILNEHCFLWCILNMHQSALTGLFGC